jgi:thiol-disulfide isomerase/thioredoxin
MNTLVLALAFSILAILVYRFWKPIIASPKRSVPKNQARLYFFYTDWCGFSQKAQPEWKKLETMLGKTPYFGTTKVVGVPVNAETDKSTAELYEVDAYPTIKLETSDGIYEYTRGVNADKLFGFLRESLGKESASL